MMNELFLLGELMEEPASGYELRNAMQVSLGKNRKISYGVIYPLLEKLKEQGFVTIETSNQGRTKKMATLTEEGKKRFYELMQQEVPEGAYRDDIYKIKLDVMQHLPLSQQKDLLLQFMDEQQKSIEETQTWLRKLSKERSIDHWYAGKKFELRLAEAQLAKEWGERFLRELKNRK